MHLTLTHTKKPRGRSPFTSGKITASDDQNETAGEGA